MLLKIYPENPNQRAIEKVVDLLKQGEIIIYPTDTLYAFGCDMLQPKAVEKLYKIKGADPKKKSLSMICRDLSALSEYAKVDNRCFKLLKRHLPGPYTFILNGSNNLPRILKERKEIGIRIPDNSIAMAILETLGHPMLSASLGDELVDTIEYINDPELIHEHFMDKVKLVIDGGIGGLEPSTVVNCTEDEFEIIRMGKGEITY